MPWLCICLLESAVRTTVRTTMRICLNFDPSWLLRWHLWLAEALDRAARQRGLLRFRGRSPPAPVDLPSAARTRTAGLWLSRERRHRLRRDGAAVATATSGRRGGRGDQFERRGAARCGTTCADAALQRRTRRDRSH